MLVAEDESDQEPEQLYSGFLIRLVSVCGVRTMAYNGRSLQVTFHLLG